MSPPCPQCVSRLFCTIHHSRPEAPPPPVTPQPKAVVPRSFTFYQPSVPIILPKPIDELMCEEIRAIIAKHSPPVSESSKRPMDSADPNPDQNAPGPSKRQRKPTDGGGSVVLPPTIRATIPVGRGGSTQQRPRRVACECWNFMTACEAEEPPVGTSRAELIAADIADLESRVFRLCRRPQSATRICCLLCWIFFGHWKTWVNNDGLTTRIREHLDNHHHHEYRDKCQPEGVTIPSLDASSVSSKHAFSSSKLTCTRERNNISAEHMEYLQVLKHSLHRRKANHDNNQTHFMAHVVDPDGEELAEY